MIRGLCRALLHLFFASVESHNLDRIPRSGPVLIISNHHSSLVDPAALITTLPRAPRFLAKSTLWGLRYLPLRPFLALARAIPVHRRKDGGGDNTAMFAAARDALVGGSVVALFAEGVSHNLPGLHDLRTGAARIALGTAATVRIVPVGIIYDDRARYRSHVMVYAGEPIEVVGSEGGDEDRQEVDALTARLAEALEDVAPSYESWRQHNDARVAARVTVAVRPELEYADVLTAANNAVDDQTDAGVEMCAAVDRLGDELDRLGLDLELVADTPSDRLASLDRRSIVSAVLWWPVVAIGRLVNLVPFTTIRVLARTQSLNFQATLKILVGVFVYPLWWIVLGVLVGALVTPLAGAAVVVAAPILGYLAGERATHLRRLTNRLSLEDLEASTEPRTRKLFDARNRVVEATSRVVAEA